MSSHSGTRSSSGPKDYSPFTPGVPVPVEFFVGRSEEIGRLVSKVAQASTGRIQVAFLSGEPGIGKTSVASFVRALAERNNQALTLHTFLGGVTSIEEVVRLVFDRLVKESVDKPWYTKVSGFLGNHIQKVGLFGVSAEFNAQQQDLSRLAKDFAPALRNLLASLTPEKKILLIVLDDINGLADSAVFANWLKSLVDEIATSAQPLALCLLLVGLEERRQALIARQPSLARVFDLIELRAWSDEESSEFFKQAFESVRISVEEAALNFLTTFTGGLPVLAHEIGDATFKADKDGRIDRSDAAAGVVTAADIVGKKYLEPQVFRVVRSQKYRAILRKLAGSAGFNMEFKRKDLLQRASADERRVLDNFLQRMKALGVIHSSPDGGPGSYEFSNLLHYFYFSLEAKRASGEPIESS